MPRSSRSRGPLVLAAISALSGAMRGRRGAGALAAAAVLWIVTSSSALALELVVDTFGDSAAAGFQACTAAGGDCTLRGAILRANAVAGPHTITLPVGTYTIAIQGQNEDAAATGDLDIVQTITINGVSPATTVVTWDETIPAANRDRIFHVHPAGNLTVRDLSLRQGVASGFLVTDGGKGGAILARGPLTVERASIRINHAEEDGGGLWVHGATTIRNSTINNNTADGSGGGIAVDTASGVPTTPSLFVENSTISTNVALVGGGLQFDAAGSTVTLSSVTVANNTAQAGGGMVRNAGNVFLRNTIVANNTGSMANPNCNGTFNSQGNNLVFGGDTCGMVANATETTDIVNTGNPVLATLADYGGPTATHALGHGSAALDKGNPAIPGSGGNACAAADQRGLTRSIDGNGDGVTRCDIGAAEGGRWLQVDTTLDNNALQTCDSNPNNANCSLRGAISVANANLTLPTVMTLPATGAGNPYRLTVGGAGENNNATGDLDIRSGVTIVGGGAGTTIIDGNQIDRILQVAHTGAGFSVVVQDVTVQNGNSGPESGGGIHGRDRMTLLRVRVRSNTGASGGGIYVGGGSGGTPADFSVIAIRDSTISGNVANEFTGGVGGGIHQQSPGSLTITNTTIAGNQATGASVGGGIAQHGGSAGPVNFLLANVTLAGNSAFSNGGMSVGTAAAFQNTIVAGNIIIPPLGVNPNCGASGTYTSNGFNLVFGGDTCGFIAGGDLQNVNPMLQPLALNGGSTETMALGSGSAAIDAGNTASPGSSSFACAATDQRGTPRPVDGNGMSGPRCDIGAYEAAACTTRPKVALGVVPGSPGRIAVGVTAGSGNIAELRLHALPQTNVQVSIGALVNQSGELVVPINAPTANFTIRRANGSGAGTLPFDVVDGCGVWKTLAGGGPNAWPAGGSSADEPPADPAAAPSTPAATLPGCSPRRPDIRVTTSKPAPGRLQAVLGAQTTSNLPNNSLISIRIGSITNASVTLDGSSVTPGQSVTLPPGTQQVTLLLERQSPGHTPDTSSAVSFVVTDACGEWGSFVGSGSGS